MRFKIIQNGKRFSAVRWNINVLEFSTEENIGELYCKEQAATATDRKWYANMSQTGSGSNALNFQRIDNINEINVLISGIDRPLKRIISHGLNYDIEDYTSTGVGGSLSELL